MKWWLLGAGLLLMAALAWFGWTWYAGPGPGNSGITGQVLIGPMCPVVQEGVPCPDRPFQAQLAVLTESGRRVTTVRTDDQGRFRVALRPGLYVLVPRQYGIQHAPQVPANVPPDGFTEVTITYDSGIR